MASARELYNTADIAFKRGRWQEALAGFAGVVQASPVHLKTRLRLADCLLNLGEKELALRVYRAFGLFTAKTGQPLLGLMAAKMVELLDPDDEDITIILSELYANTSHHIDPGTTIAAYPALDDRAARPVADDNLRGEAARIGEIFIGAASARLPPMPFFSLLEEASFFPVVRKVRLRRFADGEHIIRQGERADAFYFLVDGEVLVRRDSDELGGVTLARLRPGAVFGEKSLISDEPRHASVVASGEAEILEVRGSDLIVVASMHADVSDALKTFTRDRFLGNLTATHSFFQPLDNEARRQLTSLFSHLTFQKDQIMIQQGEPGRGLFLLLGGHASVDKETDEERFHLATLQASDLCGEMSLIGDHTTTATVTATDAVDALFLPRESFNSVIKEHPELMRYLTGLSEIRVRHNRALLLGHGLLEDDQHVMI